MSHVFEFLFSKINTNKIGKRLNYLDDSLMKETINSLVFDLNNLQKSNTESNTVQLIKKIISKIPRIDNFRLIGEISIQVGQNLANYEVFCKFNEAEDELEILLNDVSKYKLHEDQLNLRTLFLSKISHEFKNPLLSMTELVNQSIEDLNDTTIHDSVSKHNILDNFSQIKALSDFLLILIKDLNQFSEAQLGLSTEYEKQKTNIREVVEFCGNITTTLLKKVNKIDQVEFTKIISPNVPQNILTNEGRLKQVIVNLLSNAVKFTYYGRIVLEILLEEGAKFLRFTVKDSGTGIKEDQQKKLFLPFQKGHQLDNEIGSGLGLSIVKEIVQNLGGEITFKSEPNVGSQFSFTIPLLNKEALISSDSVISLSKTVKRYEPSEIKLNISNKTNESKLTVEAGDLILERNVINELNLYKLSENNSSGEDEPSRNLIKNSFQKSLNSSDSSDEEKREDNTPDIYKTPEIKLRRNESYKETPTVKLRQRRKSVLLSIKDFYFENLDQLRKQTSCTELILRMGNISNSFINVIVTDDESLTRLSSIRILKNVCKKMKIKVNIVESSDGLETVFLVYKAITLGIKISFIFSDENMNFLNGVRSSSILKEVYEKKKIRDVPFYLLTACSSSYNEEFLKQNNIQSIITKPLNSETAEHIILKYAS